MADDEAAAEALVLLAEMGYSGGAAVDALMRAKGDVWAAADILAEEEGGGGGGGDGHRGSGSGGGRHRGLSLAR